MVTDNNINSFIIRHVDRLNNNFKLKLIDYEEEIIMFDFLKRDDSKVIHVNDMDNLIGKVELIDIKRTL